MWIHLAECLPNVIAARVIFLPFSKFRNASQGTPFSKSISVPSGCNASGWSSQMRTTVSCDRNLSTLHSQKISDVKVQIMFAFVSKARGGCSTTKFTSSPSDSSWPRSPDRARCLSSTSCRSASAAMAADAERQEVEERQRALSGDLGQDESDGEDVNFVVEHPPLAFDTNANMICTFTSEIFCECSVERLRSHETVVRICDDHPLALHPDGTDIDFEKGVPCEAFRNLLKGKKITRAAITLGKHSARWIHIEPPCKAEIHFSHARRPLGAANFEDGSTFVDYGFPSAGPCRYFPAAHESADRLLELGLRPPSKGGAGWTAPLVAEGLRCCGRACCNGKYKEPPETLPGDDSRGPELSYLTPREGCCAVS